MPYRSTPALAALLLALLWLAPAAARDTESIRVLASAARPAFPDAITFELAAEASDADIVAVQLLYGETRSEALTIADVAITPGRQVQAEHRLDTRVYYVPPGAEITYRWQIRDAAGNLLASEPQRLLYHDTRFEWSERSERNVTVLWYEGGASFGQELIETSTRTLDRLQTEIGAQLDLPVRIYIYADVGDMRGALESNEVEWVGGAAWPDLGVIVGAIEAGDTGEARRIIPHELSHQVLHQATDNPYGGVPRWFDEGLAVYYEENDGSYYGGQVADAARAGRLIPLEALAASFPTDPELAGLSYAQSREVVAYIDATYGADSLRALAESFAAATPLEQAVQGALGVSIDELDAAWRATLGEVGAQPTPAPGPQTAPDERFEEPPVLPAGVAPDPARPSEEIDWTARITALPAWASIGGLALCCVGVAMLAGSVLLVAMRLLGVDKRA